MTRRAGTFCCTSPGALCFSFGIFLIFFGLGYLSIEFWPALRGFETVFLIGAIGLACSLNAFRNRTFHCMITGPAFLLLAGALALAELGVWSVPTSLVWGLLLIIAGTAVIFEQRFAR